MGIEIDPNEPYAQGTVIDTATLTQTVVTIPYLTTKIRGPPMGQERRIAARGYHMIT
jgi:hypothetical protein